MYAVCQKPHLKYKITKTETLERMPSVMPEKQYSTDNVKEAMSIPTAVTLWIK